MATGLDILSSGDDADSVSETSSVYTSNSSDNDSMDFEEGYDAAGNTAASAATASGGAEVCIIYDIDIRTVNDVACKNVESYYCF